MANPHNKESTSTALRRAIGRCRIPAVAIGAVVCACGDETPNALRAAGAASRQELTTAVDAPVTCTVTAPGQSCGGVTVGIAPYAPGDPFGQFQSGEGTGPSSSITITFSAPVRSVTVTVEDPTWNGNSMTAFDARGTVVGTAGFPGNQQPGTNVPATRTISGSGIVRVVLTPAADDYVAYAGLTFEPEVACELFAKPDKVDDPLLADARVQEIIKKLIRDTGWGKPLAEQAEQGGYWIIEARSPELELTFLPYDMGSGLIPPGPCLSGMSKGALDTLREFGFVIVGQMHTHPNAGSKVLDPGNCYRWDPKKGPVSVPKNPDGTIDLSKGPSSVDKDPWRKKNAAPPYPGYVIEPDRITRWERDPATGKFVQKSFPFSKCVKDLK